MDVDAATVIKAPATPKFTPTPKSPTTPKSPQKFRPGVNFINILRTNFSYDHRFGSFFQLHFGFVKKFVQKTRAYNIDEIDYR